MVSFSQRWREKLASSNTCTVVVGAADSMKALLSQEDV